MKLEQPINTADLPQTSSSPIPAGWYPAQIAGVELKTTKSGNGQYLAIQYKIVGEKYAGSMVFANINIRNISSRAQEIGLSQLGVLLRSIGLISLTDTDQMVGTQMQIKVKIQPAKDGYDAQNDVGNWKALDGGALPPGPSDTSSDMPAWRKAFNK